MSLKRQCDRCGRLCLVKDDGHGLFPEGYSRISQVWNLNKIHAAQIDKKRIDDPSISGDVVNHWELCLECTMQLREFFGIPRDADTHTGEK